MATEINTEVTGNPAAKPVTSRLSPILFLAGVLFFFLPFIDIRCNDVSLQEVKGINLATGFKINNDGKSLTGKLNQLDQSDWSFSKNGGERKLNEYALLALIAGIVGLVLSLIPFKNQELSGIITGLLSAAALIGMMGRYQFSGKNRSVGKNR